MVSTTWCGLPPAGTATAPRPRRRAPRGVHQHAAPRQHAPLAEVRRGCCPGAPKCGRPPRRVRAGEVHQRQGRRPVPHLAEQRPSTPRGRHAGPCRRYQTVQQRRLATVAVTGQGDLGERWKAGTSLRAGVGTATAPRSEPPTARRRLWVALAASPLLQPQRVPPLAERLARRRRRRRRSLPAAAL